MNRVFNSVFVRDVLFENGLSEDGELRYVKAWNIYVENDFGERLVHTASDFTDLDPKGLESAERFAKKVQDQINKGGTIVRSYWYDVDPSYGSKAYQDFGTEAEVIEWERRE